jgi:hypothetical protein
MNIWKKIAIPVRKIENTKGKGIESDSLPV